MKTTNAQLLAYINILNRNADKKLPQKISFAITKNLMGLDAEFKCYSKELNKILEHYKEYQQQDEEGNPMFNKSQIPILTDKEKTKEMVDELNELLSIEIDIDLYSISEDLFDYEDADGRYDALSGIDISELMAVLCDKEENEE